MTTTRSCPDRPSGRRAGMAVDQATVSVALASPGQPAPCTWVCGHRMRRPRRAPRGGGLAVRYAKVLPTSTLSEIGKTGCSADPVEQRGDGPGVPGDPAPPARARPYGVGSLSKTLTVTPVWVSNSSAAYMPAGPKPTTATPQTGPVNSWCRGHQGPTRSSAAVSPRPGGAGSSRR